MTERNDGNAVGLASNEMEHDAEGAAGPIPGCEPEDWTVRSQARLAACLHTRAPVTVSSTDLYWLEQNEADVPPENDWLSAKEAACLNAMNFIKRRTDWRLGRWTAKCALSAYLSAPAAVRNFKEIEICPATDGAPEAFFEGQRAPVAISLSHRSGTAICAVAIAGVHIGCDLETVEPHTHAFIADYFTANEQTRIAQTSADDRDLLVTLLWSVKESALKALRTGLRLDTRSVIVNHFVPSFDFNGWSQLSVHYEGCCPPADRDRQGLYFGDHIFQGWWQNEGDIVRTMVAAPSPNSPIRLKMPDHTFDRPYRYASEFA